MDRESESTYVDRLVASVNPIPAIAEVFRDEHRLALESLHKAIAVQPWQRRRRLDGRSKAAALMLAAVLLIGATTGAAEWVRVHTGTFGAPGMSENDTSEWLRGDSPEIINLIDGLTPKYALPPGGNWSQFKKAWPMPQPSYVQATGVEADVATEAICQWDGYWLASYQAGDMSGQRASLAVLDAIPDWAIVRRVDGGGFADNLRLRARFAHEGNLVEFQRLFELNCRQGSAGG